MTTFGDQLYQYGGAPVGLPWALSGTQNQATGTVYFVNSDTGSDGNKGTRADKPLATIAKAYSLMKTNNHDTCVLSAVSALSESDELTVSKNRLHFIGMDAVGRYLGARSRWTMGVTTGSAIAVVQNTGVGNTFSRIKFDSSDTLATSLYAFADGGEYTVIDHCELAMSTQLDDTGGGVLLCNADSPYYYHNAIGSLVYQFSVKRTNVLMNRTTISGKVARDVTFEDCLFLINTSSSDASQIHGDGATDIERFMLLKNCQFINAVLGTADPDQAVEFDAALTQGYVLATGCAEVGHTAFSTTTGVFVSDPVANAAGVSALQAS